MLPVVGRDERLRWDPAALAEALDATRRQRGLTWETLATELRCTEHQIQRLRTIRCAIGMRPAGPRLHDIERRA
jgi:hypothetical protein